MTPTLSCLANREQVTLVNSISMALAVAIAWKGTPVHLPIGAAGRADLVGKDAGDRNELDALETFHQGN
jgi:hypothetical protein